ncbi:MAG: DUF4340 domain-containing protein [Bauldia sp.]
MTPKTFLGLAGAAVLAVAAAGAALVADFRSLTASAAGAGKPAFPALANPDNAARVIVKAPAFNLDLVRQGDKWLMADRGNYPVHASAVAQIVGGLSQMKLYEPKTNNKDWFKEVQVDDPGTTGSKAALITVNGKGGEPLANTIVGIRSRSIGANPLGGTFIRAPGENQAWLAEGTVTLPDDFTGWFDQIVHIPGPDVIRISIVEDGKLVFKAVKRNDAAQTFGLTDLAEKYGDQSQLVAIDSAVKLLDLGIVSTTFDDVKAVTDIPFGTNDRVVRFETRDGMTLELQLYKAPDGKIWVKYAATTDSGAADAARAKEITNNTKGFAFLLPKYRTDPLLVGINTLVQPAPPPEVEKPAQRTGPRIEDIPVVRPPARLTPR